MGVKKISDGLGPSIQGVSTTVYVLFFTLCLSLFACFSFSAGFASVYIRVGRFIMGSFFKFFLVWAYFFPNSVANQFGPFILWLLYCPSFMDGLKCLTVVDEDLTRID